MKVLAIDYGDARTGIAVSDLTGSIVGFTTVIHSWNQGKTIQEILRLTREQGVERVVMGYPRNMDGSEGPRAELYRAFASDLEQALGMPVRLWDERLTTVDAQRILSDNGVYGKKRKNRAACIAYIMHEYRLLSEPPAEYFSLLDDGYARWGFDHEILFRALEDSIGKGEGRRWLNDFYKEGT